MAIAALASEWRRVETLCEILRLSRQGQAAGEGQLAELRQQQTDVMATRAAGAWSSLGATGLSHLAFDILALVIAPEVSHVVAYAYASLAGLPVGSSPDLRLVQALLSLEPGDLEALRGELQGDAPLRAAGLIAVEQTDAATVVRCSRRLREAVFGSVTLAPPHGTIPIHRKAGWDDLVLPPACRVMLEEYCRFISARETVEGAWGARRRGGPVALFSGPSGTGKTLAASVLASAIGWPLYRVDLGMLVSKYIGETEKNLNALFDAVEDTRSILLFDESESLFGRRGEVKEARDRYANMEVSHLLTRIENQHCPCILTTNLRSSIDAAFLRRFQVIVDFPLPDERERRSLWRRHIPPHAPLASDLDFKLLARHARLTGAAIESAALHAAHMAAATDAAIGMGHVVRGVWREMSKAGVRHTRTDLGPLARFLTEEEDDSSEQADAQAAA